MNCLKLYLILVQPVYEISSEPNSSDMIVAMASVISIMPTIPIAMEQTNGTLQILKMFLLKDCLVGINLICG